jgi:hypothetical protein
MTNNHGEELAAVSIVFDQQDFVGHIPILAAEYVPNAKTFVLPEITGVNLARIERSLPALSNGVMPL